MKSMQTVFLLLFALPVLGAQYFSLDQSLVDWVSAMLSLCLLVLLLGLVLGRLRHGVVRTSVGLGMVTVLACYFFGQFLSYYLQGSYFNQQFYFHLNVSTLIETWASFWPLAILFIAWMVMIWLSFLYFRNRLDSTRPSASLMTLLLLTALSMDPGLRQSAMASLVVDDTPELSSLEDVQWQRLKLNPEVLQSQRISATAGKNLVLIFLEGLDKIYTEDSLFPGLTPNLNNLREPGGQLARLIQVPGSEWTMGGLVSSLCGTQLLHDLGLDGNSVMFASFLDRANCLPDILDSAGYQQAFMGGASLGFAGKGEFLKEHRYGRVMGSEELVPRLEDPSHLGGWGLYDESLFALAVDEFERLSATGQPFNLTLLTVDTHHPTGEPSPGCAPYAAEDNSILHAVHCTDQLVGDFIAQLQQQPSWQDTIVVLLSDHLGMRNNAYPLFPEEYERTLYFSVINGELGAAAQRPATPMDIAPTVLGLLQVDHSAVFLAGGNLLQANNLTMEDLAILPEREEAIRYINSNYLSSRESQLHYSLDDSRLRHFDFSNHVSAPDLDEEGLRFLSTGEDPYVILPELTLDAPQDAHLFITLEVEQPSAITLYYSTSESLGYSEASTLSYQTVAGENHVVFNLANVARTGRLRIDPGASPGRYLISFLEVRS